MKLNDDDENLTRPGRRNQRCHSLVYDYVIVGNYHLRETLSAVTFVSEKKTS